MNKAVTAALLSTFLFPGAGHYFLKKYFPGTLLAMIALVSFSLIAAGMVERAMVIAEKIQLGEVAFDIGIIAGLVSKPPAGTDGQFHNITWIVLILTWLIGIVDSYRVGARLSKTYIEGKE